MHVYVWEHIVSLFYRTDRWMFTKLGREEVLMTLPLGQIRPGSDPGWSKNKLMRGPFSKGLLLQIGM